MADVFISYSHEDRAFVRRLFDALEADDRDVWVDWEGIPPTSEWLNEIYSAVESADNFLFIISPDSVVSKVCGLELAHAVQFHKRIIPIVYRETDDITVPETLAALQWIFFRENDDFGAAFRTLVEAIDTDLEWVRAHTRLLERALEWENGKRDRSFLLHGNDLKGAENWLERGAQKEPKPTQVQAEYIAASRKATRNRRKVTFGAVSFGLILALVAVNLARVADQEADNRATQQAIAQQEANARETQEIIAKEEANARATAQADAAAQAQAKATAQAKGMIEAANRATAEANQALLTRAERLTSTGRAIFEEQPLLGLRLALEGYALIPPGNEQVRNVVVASIQDMASWGRLSKLGSDVEAAHVSPNGPVVLLDRVGMPGQVHRIDDGSITELIDEIRSVEFSPDPGKTFYVIDYENAPEKPPTELRFSADGSTLALPSKLQWVQFSRDPKAAFFVARYFDAPGELRQTATGEVISTLADSLFNVRFSSDPRTLAFAVDYSVVDEFPDQLRRTANGEVIATLSGEVDDVYFRPDQSVSRLVIEYSDRPGELRQMTDGAIVATLAGQVSKVDFSSDPEAAAFVVRYKDAPHELRCSQDGSLISVLSGDVFQIMTYSPDSNARYFMAEYRNAPTELRRTADGAILATLDGDVDWATFSPDPGASVVMIDYVDAPDELRRTLDGAVLAVLPGEVRTVRFRPDEQATSMAIDYTDTPDELRRTIDGSVIRESGETFATTFSGKPDNTYFVVSYEDAPSELRLADGRTLIATLAGSARAVTFGGDPNTAYVVVNYDGLESPDELRRTADGEVVTALTGHVEQASFSPDKKASYLVVHYSNAPNELRRTADGTVIGTFEGNLASAMFGSDSEASYFVAKYFRMPGELRRASDGAVIAALDTEVDWAWFSPDPRSTYALIEHTDGQLQLWEGHSGRLLADLGLGRKSHTFDPDGERLVVQHEGGRVYVLDTAWLQAMGGRATAMTADELAAMACRGPFASRLFDQAALHVYLEGEESRVCR